MNILYRFKTECPERLNAIKTDRYALASAVICVLLATLILYSLYVRVQMYMLGITLWEDEARLAENIVDRNMIDMLTPPLANLQTAPALYLVFTKVLTLIFGTSEAILRLPSFIALIGLLIVQWFLMRKVFRIRILYTMFALALSSTFLYYMQYSHELKSYMGDAMFVLVVLFAYYAYREGHFGKGLRSPIFLALIFGASMLFATPAAFAAGAVFIVEFVWACLHKDKRAALHIVLSGIIFIVIFIMNYFLWLAPIATDGMMVDYWRGFKFDFMIFTRGAISHNYAILSDMLAPVWHYVWLIIPLTVCGFAISLARRCIYTATVGVFVLLLLIASAVDGYPIANRLWLFAYAIIFIYCFVFIDALRIAIADGKAARLVQWGIPIFLSALLLVPNFSFPAYGRGEEWTLTPGNQAKPLIEYVRENIQEGETLYSYHIANKILKYENGYHTNTIGDVSSDNIIYGIEAYGRDGTEYFDPDIERIVETSGAYILFYHSYQPLSYDFYIPYVIERLQERGYLELIMDVYHTPLYWFTTDRAKLKGSAAFGVSDLKSEDGRVYGVVHAENTGASILSYDNPYDYGKIYAVLREAGNDAGSIDLKDVTVLGEFASPIMQGERADLWVERDGLVPGEYYIDFIANDMFSFSELGFEPIPFVVE
ncbi:MAG: hypothetical protein FWH32_00040 [Clostridiales bacterium]|nr:hypothetical protein [Clostridiales bacterium]